MGTQIGTGGAMSIAVLLLTLLSSAAAVWVDLNEAGSMCFLEEVPKDTLVLAKWLATPSDRIHPESAASIGINLKITDPEQYTFFDQTFGKESRYAFTSARGGEYKLCFGTN